MSFADSFFAAVGETTGRVLAYVLIGAVLLGSGYALYRHLSTGPDTDPQKVTEVKPGLPPILEETTVVRPDSTGSWIIETVPGDFDATLTIDLPEEESSSGASGEAVIGLREGAKQFFPEAPGQRKLPLKATVIGPYERENVRIKSQPQPIIAFELQAELGLSFFASSNRLGGTLAGTGARIFGARLGGFLAVAPTSGADRLNIQVGTGPYASLRVYGPFGVGVGKDLTGAPLTSLQGLSFMVTADVPLQ